MRKRGSTLILVLGLSGLLLCMGIAFLASRAGQYQVATQAAQAAQARALALAGLEDARVKLEKDVGFAPPGADDQPVFSYAEDVTAVDGSLVGRYVVWVDRGYLTPPYELVRITAAGYLGLAARPIAQHVVTAELDMARQDRADPSLPNARLFKLIRFQDQGAL